MFSSYKRQRLDDAPLEKTARFGNLVDQRHLKFMAAGGTMGGAAGHVFGEDTKDTAAGALAGALGGAGFAANTQDTLLKILQREKAVQNMMSKGPPSITGTGAKILGYPAVAGAAAGALIGDLPLPLIHNMPGVAWGGGAGLATGMATLHGLMSKNLLTKVTGRRQTNHYRKLDLLQDLVNKGKAEYMKRGLLGAVAASGLPLAGLAFGGSLSELASKASDRFLGPGEKPREPLELDEHGVDAVHQQAAPEAAPGHDYGAPHAEPAPEPFEAPEPIESQGDSGHGALKSKAVDHLLMKLEGNAPSLY